MRVYLPRGYPSRRPYRLLIALHGWNRRARSWERRSAIARLADRHGLVVGCPVMGRTVYETAYYPQTRGLGPRTPRMPGTRWIRKVVLPHLHRRYRVSASRRDTGLLGVSTGGRGALLVAERDPRFGFAGALSGTFDLLLLRPGSGEYRIHQRVYGSRARHGRRWRRDNPVRPALLRGLRLGARAGTGGDGPATAPARPAGSPRRNAATAPARPPSSPRRQAATVSPRPAGSPRRNAATASPRPAGSLHGQAATPPGQPAGWIPVFLAHGLRDRSVRSRQTRRMARALRSRGAQPCVVLDPTGGHDWRFWNAQLPAALACWLRKPPGSG
jgi:hypothetical protein